MAINIEDRRKIKDFVNNQYSLINYKVHTLSGPCADWVAGIIEKATGRQILDKEGVFNNNISRIYRGVLIPDYATLLQTVQDGDILYVVDSYTGNTTHYMLFCNVVVQNQGLHVRKNSLGVNGGFQAGRICYPPSRRICNPPFWRICYPPLVSARPGGYATRPGGYVIRRQ